MATINHTALLLRAAELPVCFSSRSRSTHTTRYNNRWIILSDGSGEGVNAYPGMVYGVAYDHFQWSRSNGQVDTHCPYIILTDGLGLYGKGLGYSWLEHGVARYVYSGRGVCILVQLKSYGWSCSTVLEKHYLVILLPMVFSELPTFFYSLN